MSELESEAEPLYETLDEQAEGLKKNKKNGKPQLRTGEGLTAVVGVGALDLRCHSVVVISIKNLYNGTRAGVLSDSEV